MLKNLLNMTKGDINNRSAELGVRRALDKQVGFKSQADLLGGQKGHGPPTQLKFTQYHLVFIIFDHVKYKIF
jgi:hypothetical protein